MVFGRRAGQHALEYAKSTDFAPVTDEQAQTDEKMIADLMDGESEITIPDIRRAMGNLMADKVGVYRNEKDLREAESELADLQEKFKTMRIVDKTKAFNTTLVSALELKNMLDLAQVVTAGALARTESRGAHWREDHPERNDDDWLHHTMAVRGANGEPELEFDPVTITEFKPEARTY